MHGRNVLKRVAGSQQGNPATARRTHLGLSPSQATALNSVDEQVNLRAGSLSIEDAPVHTDEEDLEIPEHGSDIDSIPNSGTGMSGSSSD